MDSKMTKVEAALETIFDWGYGFGGLLFSIFVGAPLVGLLIAAFISVLVFIFTALGLV
jgi:hypothetical protein